MAKLSKDFFTNNEVLFVGYSVNNNAFSKTIYEAFANKGIKVYPLNNKNSTTSSDIKVYKCLEELPKMPKCAYILVNKRNTGEVVKQLADKGIERILFHNKKIVDASVLEECKSGGIETQIACPMMILGSDIHRIHAFFAGVR